MNFDYKKGRLIILKMKYEKPMLAVEYYQLTQAIASCVTKIGFNDSNCVLKDEDATWQMKDLAYVGFFTDNLLSGCGLSAEGMDGYDGICYHTNANSAFNS